MIANIGSIDHKVYKLTRNDYTMYSKLKYTSNSNLTPYCIGDWVTYSSNKCLIFSDSMKKNVLFTAYRENGNAHIRLIDKEFISGIVRKQGRLPIEGEKSVLSEVPIKKRGIYSAIQLYSKNAKEFFGDVGDEIELKHSICEFDHKPITHKIEERHPGFMHGIPEKFIIHGIVDYTIYHLHRPYRNEFFTQNNPFWDKLYHGVHIIWDKNLIVPNRERCYIKLHVGDILIDSEGIIHIAAIHNKKNGFYSFKHFQFHSEDYYKKKDIKLYAVDDHLHIVPLVCLLWHYGLSLGAKLNICR